MKKSFFSVVPFPDPLKKNMTDETVQSVTSDAIDEFGESISSVHIRSNHSISPITSGQIGSFNHFTSAEITHSVHIR
jgi:hypothetical protein